LIDGKPGRSYLMDGMKRLNNEVTQSGIEIYLPDIMPDSRNSVIILDIRDKP